ncbi:hypothetical protein EDB81DRAFT_784470 [Dactylonectria macrodidyma]|uniref:Uncharacterized protein n=1 Tax=Dactylonectria macrodidyma TaxID=307937 RepID=A0A9P9FG00_9HYPO|nr:hypothetical protein EDB81DRAFT_784470 [Dactylonectria macrodidyma]
MSRGNYHSPIFRHTADKACPSDRLSCFSLGRWAWTFPPRRRHDETLRRVASRFSSSSSPQVCVCFFGVSVGWHAVLAVRPTQHACRDAIVFSVSAHPRREPEPVVCTWREGRGCHAPCRLCIHSTRVAKGDLRMTVEHLPRLDSLIRETSDPLLNGR